MGFFRAIGKFIWRFMVIFSFIVNIILVVVLILLLLFIFQIKNEIAQPLITGLHSSFVGLDEATIDWTIPVRDEIPVVLDIPLETDTIVVLTQPVPLSVNASIDLPGLNAENVPATVRLNLPEGLELPVALDLDVAVDQPLPVSLDVRAVIPLQETQLHDVAENLRLLFEPLARGLHNLPDDFGEAGELVGEILAGNAPDLLAENDYSRNPWPGYSRTAGLNYDLFYVPFPPDNVPVETGIVAEGGIPFMDQALRPELYTDDLTPETVNEAATANMESLSVPIYTFSGDLISVVREGSVDPVDPQEVPATGGPASTPVPQAPNPVDDEDLGIVTPDNN